MAMKNARDVNLSGKEAEVFFVLEISFSDSPVMQMYAKFPTQVLTWVKLASCP